MRMIAGTAVAVVGVALAATWYIGRPGGDIASCSESAIGADIGGPFELVNHLGKTVTDKDVFVEPSIVYFGYTYCPDVCPFDVARNADAVDLLAQQGVNATPVFITIDPARDTVEAIADYAQNMHSKMIALTGTEPQISAASKAYKTYYKRHDDGHR